MPFWSVWRNYDRITKFAHNRICKYRKNWNDHNRTGSDKIPKKILKYQSKGKWSLQRPLNQQKDCFVSSITGLNRPKAGKDDDDN
jgi:hypothetical protein